MGVDIGKLVPKKEISIEELSGKKIGIDALNWTFQFLSSVRDKFTGEPLKDSHGNVTSHLSGLFYRTTKLIESGIEPVYVFDGKPPEWKKHTIQEREKVREEARQKWIEAVEKGEEAIKYAQGASKLTSEMLVQAKELLDLMGVSWVQAPSEGEAQISKMVKENQIWAGATQDYDAILFGIPRVIRNLNIAGKKKLPGKQTYIEVKPEFIEINEVLKGLELNQEQLIVLGLLVGTDFNPGIKGFGPKKSLELVKQEKTLENVLKKINWDFEVPAHDLFEFFKNPPAGNVEIQKKKIDIEGLRKFLIDDHDFSEERINSTLEKLQETKKKGQSGLGSFFGK